MNSADLIADAIRNDWAEKRALMEPKRGSCDECGLRPNTHRHDQHGIETWICDECAEGTS